MKTFVMGDIHGAYKALVQCLERSEFDKENDTLIQLGDIVDGYSESFECVEELLTIKNLISIKGNHDQWFNQYLETGKHPVNWTHGGWSTRSSYSNREIPLSHKEFFAKQLLYYKDKQNNIFVHGGFNRLETLRENEFTPHVFYWDRDLWQEVLSAESINKTINIVEPHNEIFLGHTNTMIWGKDTPMKAKTVWNLDTNAGWGDKLTIMNVETKEFFQSDKIIKLYPNDKGRR